MPTLESGVSQSLGDTEITCGALSRLDTGSAASKQGSLKITLHAAHPGFPLATARCQRER